MLEKVFRSKKIEMVSPIKYVRARTKEGKLTNFKTGDRFVDVVIPSEPLPKKGTNRYLECLYISQRAKAG